MAQLSDVMHASAVFDAARQELAWAYTDMPEPLKGLVDTISKVLNEAEMRWVTSTREAEPVAAAVDKDNGMAAVVVTGHEEEKKEREGVAGVVKKVGTRSMGEAERKTKDWLLRLEEVACDMRAVARKELLGGIGDKPSARWLPCLPRTRRAARIADPTVYTVALELEKLKKQYGEEFGYSTGLPLAATCTEQPVCSSTSVAQEERETSVTGDALVERGDGVKQRIIDIINVHMYRNNPEELYYDREIAEDETIILPIFGPPCIGKTTLVKSIFYDEDALGACYKVWVDMPKGWGIKEIHESIIKAWDCFSALYVGEANSEADYYYKLMMAPSLLLVLDNLVEEQDLSMLDELLGFLHEHVSHVIAIVTTRSQDLARYIARSSKIAEYRLHPCSDDMCWEIIKQTSGHDLEATAAGTAVALSKMDGCEIASKCSGIPLAAKALGRFLQSVDPQQWPGLIRDVWNIGGGFSSDSQQLRRLPIHSATVFTHLKLSSGVLGESWLTLAYCAFFLFPKGKGHGVVTRDLLNQWCSLGITTREGGASCISELLDRSLLLGEKPASNASEEAATLLTMEDVMHNFARYLLGDRLIVVDGKNGATPSKSSPLNNKSSSAYLALVRNFDAKQLDISSILPAGILALRFELCGEMELSDGAFESFGKYLRLLDLSGYSEKKMLPDFIRHLKQLRYLVAPSIQDQELPRSITGLRELRYLILRRSCQLKDLNKAFQMLSNLFHLDLSECSGLKALPDSFGRLWRLEHLDLSASGIEALPESFSWLRNLRHLDLSGCSGLKVLHESFGGLNKLWHLDLSRCSGLQDLPKSFQYLTELRHLDLSGLSKLQALPMVSLPRELRHLNLSGCTMLQKGLPNAPGGSELQHLDLSGCMSVLELPGSYATIKKLVHLNLSRCACIELPLGRWTSQLEHLDLSYCMFEFDLLDLDLQKLQYLDLSGASFSNLATRRLVDTVRNRGGSATGPEDVPEELILAFWEKFGV